MRRRRQLKSGRSSGVEHNLAKVGVEGSNPFARSRTFSIEAVDPPRLFAFRGGGPRGLARGQGYSWVAGVVPMRSRQGADLTQRERHWAGGL